MHTVIKECLACLPDYISDSDKVWIFQSSSKIEEHTASLIQKEFAQYKLGWLAHGAAVQSEEKLFFGRFLIVVAKEVSGCATDTLFHFIRKIEKQFYLSFLNRNILCFWVGGKVVAVPKGQFEKEYTEGSILRPTDYFFDNTVSTVGELKNRWLTPINKSWLTVG